MEIDTNLVQRAQMLLTLNHSLPQVRDILLGEGYPQDQVTELIDATEEVLNYLIPPEYDNNKIGISILHPGEQKTDTPSVDLLIDKHSGKIKMVTPHFHETWRVANEIRRAIRHQKQALSKYLH